MRVTRITFVFLWVAILSLTGCATRISSDEIRSSLASRATSLEELEVQMTKTHNSFEEFVTALNLARVLQLQKKWKESISRYDEALTLLEDYESRAIINVRDVASKIGTVLMARGAHEYYGTGYERSLLHTFNAFNYMMLGDFNGAAVEMRKMDKRQEYWLQESQARIEKKLEEKKDAENVDLPAQYSMRDILKDESLRKMVNNYQDAFSYALSAILFRLAGDIQSAEVNLRRATALDPSVATLFKNAWNHSKRTEEATIPELPYPLSIRTQESDAKETDTKNYLKTQEVTIIVLSGLAPALKTEFVRARFPKIGSVVTEFPSYSKPISGATPYASLEKGDPFTFYHLLHTDKLAYKTLKDEMTFEIGSAISRAAVRAGVAAAVYVGVEAMNHKKDDRRNNHRSRSHSGVRYDGDAYAQIASALTSVLLDLWAQHSAESVRNWETLPKEGFLAMTTVPNGSSIVLGEGKYRQSVDLPKECQGAIIMVTSLSKSNMKVDYVTY